ncbi:glucose 1-dehydrogenase [Pedobacter nutrimenti]|uniref:SDR family NAD(P)-dependent oxidoreductase n=1 Tax=Pedobacter nutrimenti TaxID=1241337 RepID=UPI00292D9DC7|nr:glucose 1-dehydrogenase [Pedobacter nutrimenti]
MDNNINLKNKNVLITGGSRGIGAGIARTMAACGANVMINHFEDELNATVLAEEIRETYHVQVWIYEADISSQERVLQMFSFADAAVGSINVLVNNAGCETIEHAVDLKLEDWDRIFNVNLRGAFICSQEAGKRMIAINEGVIINISSIHDKTPRKGLVHYCASKAAMNMMTKCLALELAEHNIRVLAVSPGAIETEMNKEEINTFGREKFNSWIPLRKIGIVDEVAWTCAFLASDKAAYVTATTIYIDGGYKESTIPYDPRTKRA